MLIFVLQAIWQFISDFAGKDIELLVANDERIDAVCRNLRQETAIFYNNILKLTEQESYLDARQLAIEAAQVSQYIYLNKPIAVIFINEVKERRSLIKMRLKAYVSDIRYEFAFQSDMTEIVLKEFITESLIHPKNIS